MVLARLSPPPPLHNGEGEPTFYPLVSDRGGGGGGGGLEDGGWVGAQTGIQRREF
jgi:hypothetical protein